MRCVCVCAHCFRLPGAEEGYHGGRSNRDSKKEALATLKSRFPGVHNIDLLLYMKLSWGRDAKNKGFPINVHVPAMPHACCRLAFTHTQSTTQRWALWLSCSLPLSISSLIERGKPQVNTIMNLLCLGMIWSNLFFFHQSHVLKLWVTAWYDTTCWWRWAFRMKLMSASLKLSVQSQSAKVLAKVLIIAS